MSGTRRKAGLLGPEVEGYRAWLTHRGYTPGTVRNMLKDLGQVASSTSSTCRLLVDAPRNGRPADSARVHDRAGVAGARDGEV